MHQLHQHPTQPATTQAYVKDLETYDLLTEEQDQEEGVHESFDDDLDDPRAEREVEKIMHFVFGEDVKGMAKITQKQWIDVQVLCMCVIYM